MHTNKSRPFAVPNYVLLLQAKMMLYFKFPLLFRKINYCASASILCLLPALLHWWRIKASSPRHEHPDEAVEPPGIEDLVRHLAEVADRKQQMTEQLVVSQARHAEDLVRLRAETAARVPLPEPRTTAHQLLTKLTSQDDLEAYLHTFEVVAHGEGCDQAEWAQLLAPLLTGEPIWGLQLTVCCIRKRLCYLQNRNPCQGGSLTDMCCTENILSSPPPEYHPEKFAVVRSPWLLRATERVNLRIKT